MASNFIVDSLEYKDSFFPCYVRNNRKNRQKSIRCFPQCLERGHNQLNFCGRSVELTVRMKGVLTSSEVSKLVFTAELHPSVKQAAYESFTVLNDRKEVVISPEYNNRMYDDFRSHPDYQGWIGRLIDFRFDEVSGLTIVRVVFNEDHHSWDYSWMSNKWVNDTKHLMEAAVFLKLDSKLVLLNRCFGSEFTISCSHKTSVKCPPSLPVKRPLMDVCSQVSPSFGRREPPMVTAEDVELKQFVDCLLNIQAGSLFNEQPYGLVRPSAYRFDMLHRLEIAGLLVNHMTSDLSRIPSK